MDRWLMRFGTLMGDMVQECNVVPVVRPDKIGFSFFE